MHTKIWLNFIKMTVSTLTSRHKFIPRYDNASVLFYIDPPYYTNESDYGKAMFRRSDFEVLNELLKELKGQFMLSLNERAEVKEIFKSPEIVAVKVTYTFASRGLRKLMK